MITHRDDAQQVYTERTDLSAATFRLLVQLTLQRRIEVTRDNAVALFERDQLALQAAIDGC